MPYFKKNYYFVVVTALVDVVLLFLYRPNARLHSVSLRSIRAQIYSNKPTHKRVKQIRKKAKQQQQQRKNVRNKIRKEAWQFW